MYKSLTAQSLHYFARPHREVRRTPIGGPGAWRSSEIADRSRWQVELTPAEQDELDAGVRAAKATGKPMGALTAGDFPLPTLARRIDTWRDEIRNGRGFVVVRGVPVARWERADAERCFYAFGLHLGVPGAQNPKGELLGHVIDEGPAAGERKVRAYRTASKISYHCDAADAVGLLCLRKACRGGESRIASSIAVYNELLARRPELVERLYAPFPLDAHGESGVDHVPIAPCRYAFGTLRTFWHSDYFRSSQAYPSAPRLSQRDHELLDTYDEIAGSPELYLDMELEPGDIQLLSNHAIIHARTSYEDHDDPALKRHLLRLWLSFPTPRSLGERMATAQSLVALIAMLLRARMRR